MKATKISYVELNTFKEGDVKIVYTDGSYFCDWTNSEKDPKIYQLIYGILKRWFN